MTMNSTPSNVVPGNTGLKPPISLDLMRQVSPAAITWYINSLTFAGTKLSSAITSATITEVINIQGSGILTLAGLITSTATTAATAKISVILDGKIVAEDLSISSLLDSDFLGFAGGLYATATTGGIAVSETLVKFNKSFIVSIAGDGTNGVQLAYKDYLT